MTSRPPPKCPPPQFGEVTHFNIEVLWGEFIDRLKEVFDPKIDGRIIVEAQQKASSKSEWETLYSGYAKMVNSRDLNAETMYDFRIRFKNKHGWGEYSEPVTIRTQKPPLTGEHIHRAIRLNDEAELEKILSEKEANIEATDNMGFTPLMTAVNKGSANIVSILIKHFANIEAKHESGKTALMLAAYRGQSECMEILLDNGGKIDNKDKSGLAALHYAVDGEQVKSIRLLLSRGADVNLKDSVLGWTPLIRCAGLKNNGNPVVAHELLRHKANIDEQDKDGKTALHNAILNSHAKMCELLLDNGASLSIKTSNGYDANTLASSVDNRAVRNVLLEFLEKRGSQG